jgi:hypothetical protein
VVKEIKRVNREVFMPLIHRPGEAQVDFCHPLQKSAKPALASGGLL